MGGRTGDKDSGGVEPILSLIFILYPGHQIDMSLIIFCIQICYSPFISGVY